MIFGTAATTATQKFRRPDSKSFCRFRDAAVPRNRQTGSTENSRSAALIQTSLRFVCRAVCDAQKNRETAGIFWTGCVIVIPSHATLSQLPPGQGIRPDTPHQCVRAQGGFRFTSASSPTRSLRSVAGAAASGVISLSIL